MKSPLALYELFDAADEEGFKVPHGTGKIKVDARLCTVLAKRTLIESDDLYRAFYLTPVRFCWSIIRWAQREAPGDITEQTKMIVSKGEKVYGALSYRLMKQRQSMQERSAA